MATAGFHDPTAGALARPADGAPAVRAPSTPGGLRVAMAAVLVALVVFGAASMLMVLRRQAATDTVGLEAAPLLQRAEALYVSLTDADAAATTTFLQAGLEPPEQRDRYVADLQAANTQLASIAEADLSPTARQAVATIAAGLPIYAGDVESARANNRLDHPVGAAYLRDASVLMRDSIRPGALVVYADAASQLDDALAAGTASGAVVAVIVGAGVVLVLLVLTQVFLVRRTRRLLNIGLAAATVLVAGAAGGAVALLLDQRAALDEARRSGSDPLLLLSTTRILALRSVSDINLHLVERGTEPQYLEDFAAVTASIGGSPDEPGLLAAAEELVGRANGTTFQAIGERYDEYLATHDRVVQLEAAGSYRQAVDAASSEGAAAASRLDAALAANWVSRRPTSTWRSPRLGPACGGCRACWRRRRCSPPPARCSGSPSDYGSIGEPRPHRRLGGRRLRLRRMFLGATVRRRAFSTSWTDRRRP